jgi:hypothetical protein
VTDQFSRPDKTTGVAVYRQAHNNSLHLPRIGDTPTCFGS